MKNEKTIRTSVAEKTLCNSQMLVLKYRLNGDICCANEMVEYILGYDDLESRNVKDLIEVNYHNTIASIVDLLRISRYIDIEMETFTRTGQVQNIKWSSFMTYDESLDEHFIFSVGHHQDRNKSPLDYLTMLNDRQTFENTVVKLLSQNKAFVVYQMDVDDFKIINELHGYSFGDYYLKSLIENIMSEEHLRVFKGSGDEIIVIEERVHRTSLSKTVGNLQDIVANTLNNESLSHKLTVCMGVVQSPKDGFDLHSIEQNIDIALNEAKSRGKNQIVLYDDMYKQSIRAKRGIEFGIDKAMETDEFELFYQPIFSMEDSSYKKYEILLRWPDAHKRGFNIGQVIDVSEQSGQILELDRYVIDKVFAHVRKHQLTQVFSINISTQSFYSDDFVKFLEEVTMKYGTNPGQIELEITEYTTVQDFDKTKEYMSHIKNLGFKILLDDFGTDYSSLNYLGKLPFDGLKIDKSYVDHVANEKKDYIVVKHLVALASELGLKTIAEGVEIDEQRQTLKRLGCDYGQGYLVSRPLPMAALTPES